MGKPVKQLSLLDLMPRHQKHKAKGWRSKGHYAKVKAKRKVVNLNEKLILQKIRDLRPNKEIAASLGITWGVVANFRREMFGDSDPLKLHIIESYNGGESSKAIARRLNTAIGNVCAILNKEGIKPWDRYVETNKSSQRNQHKQRIANRARIDQVERANDLYCMWLEVGSVREVAREAGYAECHANTFMLSIPAYKAQSKERMAQSKSNATLRNGNILSKQFKTEGDFQHQCMDDLNGYYTVGTSVRGQCNMEIDLLVEKEQCDILIELKTTSRKVIEAQALGQSLITKTSYMKKRSHAVICFPDDCRCSPGFVEVASALGVIVCSHGELKRVIDGLE